MTFLVRLEVDAGQMGLSGGDLRSPCEPLHLVSWAVSQHGDWSE